MSQLINNARTEKDKRSFFASWSENACSDSGLMHVVNVVSCAKVINTSTAFDACMCETRIGSPVAFVVQHIILLCFFPRLLTAVSRTRAGHCLLEMSVTLLKVWLMSVQQLEPVNDSRWTAGFPEVGETGERSHQQRQWQYPSAERPSRCGEHWAACIMASNRGRITQREMPLCRGEGERRGWRLIGVKCMAGNLSKALPWWDASLVS